MTTNNNGSFTGKVAFVTGAANGIGRAAALAFAHEGASVVVADVSEQGNQETARMIEEAGGRGIPIKGGGTRSQGGEGGLGKGGGEGRRPALPLHNHRGGTGNT